MIYSDALKRADEYIRRRKLTVKVQIGGGTQGVVLATESGTAVKALIRQENYMMERDAYLRLREHGVRRLMGFNVPELHNHHDELLIIEMQIVKPPYVLDFGNAYVDCDPPYLYEKRIMVQWEAKKRSEFGQHWPTVRSLMSEFKGLGIYLADIHRGNIAFRE
jgi:hypothetical protein